MKTGSMERTLTTKSLGFRQLCQWTAATSLVTAGALALFSANTLEKLNAKPPVRIDLEGFHKASSLTLALDQVSEERAFLEEERLLEKATFAAAEALPAVKVAFRPVAVKVSAKKPRWAARSAKAASAPTAKPATPGATALTAAEAAEIAQLERAVDPAKEATAMAQAYLRLRGRFVAAAETASPRAAELVAGEAYEYDELPAFDAADFQLGDETNEAALAAYDAVPEPETAEAHLGPKPPTTPAFAIAPEIVEDAIETSASAPTLAPVASATPAFDALPEPGTTIAVERHPLEPAAPAVIHSPGLDLVPLDEPAKPTTQADSPVSIQIETANPSTGPPDRLPPADKTLNSIASAVPTPKAETLVRKVETAPADVSAEPLPPAETTQADASDYAADIQSVYVGSGEEDETSADASMGYANRERAPTPGERDLADSIIDGEFPAAAAESPVARVKTRQSVASRSSSRMEEIAPAIPENARIQDFGNGISRDAGGITIDWNSGSEPGWKTNDTLAGGKIRIGKPGAPLSDAARPVRATNSPAGREFGKGGATLTAAELRDVQSKFAFGAAAIAKTGTGATGGGVADASAAASSAPTAKDSATADEPAAPPRDCDTLKLGVEALLPGAEREAITICRRALSHEGEAAKDQARWWENHNSESNAEHWPTISHQRPSDRGAKDRVPFLSTASIRILAALSRTNTHTGMGIVFGRVAQGLDVQLVGRSDAPIYLDAEMKVRDAAALAGTARQFVFLNVEAGQPLLTIKDARADAAGSIPLLVKAGMATYVDVSAPRVVDLDLTVFDSSSARESRLAHLTVQAIGHPGKLAITDSRGGLRIRKLAVFDGFPVYVDVTQSEKSYKNRYRIDPATLAAPRPAQSLYFFSEKRVRDWLSQLSGGVSPHSGVVVGIVPPAFVDSRRARDAEPRHLKIGVLEKKSQLVPERYHLDRQDGLVTESRFVPGYERYVGVQIPEGPCVPTVVDGQGRALWSTLVYAQPGVINVVAP